MVAKVPTVLFLCVHNAGRSQMAAGLLQHLSGDRVKVMSGGSAPADVVNAVVVEAMTEVGIDIRQEFPKPWTDEMARAADVVVTMGCGDTCPFFPGKRYEDWEVADPAGQDLNTVRAIREDIRSRVEWLMESLVDAPGHHRTTVQDPDGESSPPHGPSSRRRMPRRKRRRTAGKITDLSLE